MMDAQTVKIQVCKVYGNDLIYPIDENAKRFATIAGKKTLSRSDVINIQLLGFKVEQVPVSQETYLGN